MTLGYKDALRAANLSRPKIPVQQDDFFNSYLNTPVYDNLIFLKEFNPDIELSEDFVINDILFDCVKPKNIIRTRVQGRDGDVNELISNGDWQITIRGLLVSQDQLVQPREQLITLRNIIEFEGEVAIASDYLNSLDIDSIVIDNATINQQAGFRNQLPFTLQCRSEAAIELQIQDSTNAST